MTGGTEIQTLSLVEALVAAGHHPIVAVYFEYADEMVKCYQEAGAEVVMLSPKGTRPNGVKATAKHLWKGLKQIIKTKHPDVAHVQYMAPGALPVIILKFLGVRKMIATTHTPGDIYSQMGLYIIKILSKICLTSFQCITELAEKSYFSSSRLFDGKITKHFTIYNNIPSHIEIRTNPRPEIAGDAPITIGVVSRLEPIKGMDLVVPAFAEAAKRTPRLRLLVVGDGSQRELMERQATEAGLLDRVTFVGRQPQSALQDLYDKIDIILMPSRSEGFGLTAIEGMARGCVPVVANVGGLPEIVTPDCGLLHESESLNGIADMIGIAVANFNQLSQNSINRSKVFSTDNYNNQIKILYSIL